MRRIVVYIGMIFALQCATAFKVEASGVSAEACPMPGGPFVNGSEFPKNGNTNAYYWIEVVAKTRDEKIDFRGDGPSNLPDPVFEACVGQTNRVILLIGKKYDISSEGGFDIVSKSSSLVQVEALPGGGSSVRFPVTIKMIQSWTKPTRTSACSQKAGSQTRKNDAAGKVTKRRLGVSPTPEQEAEQKERQKQMKEAEERARVREERLKALEEARRPVTYDLPPGSEFELFGYVIGHRYPPAEVGQKAIHGDRVHHFAPHQTLREKFHGMDMVYCKLTPTSKRLYSMSLWRSDFSGREELMKAGVAVLESLGKMLGHTLAPFKYEAPDWPYWPCDNWSGPLPDLFVADENQWATSKNVFAVSNTRIGGVFVNVKLDVVAFDHFNLSITARDDALANESQREFEEDFKKHHDGKTFAEWSQEYAFKRSPEYKKNQTRASLPDDFKIAGHFLGELIPPAEFAGRFGKSVFYVRETNTQLSEKFLGVFSRIGIATNSAGRVSRIALVSDIMARAEQAFEKYKVAREFLLTHGLDDYYEESVGTIQEIQDFYEPEGNCWAERDLCALKWIDKSRSVWIELALYVSKKDGMKICLEARQVAQNSWTDYQWRRGLDKIRNGKRQE